jgi:hypothetical protein
MAKSRLRWRNGFGDESGKQYPFVFWFDGVEIKEELVEQVIKELSGYVKGLNVFRHPFTKGKANTKLQQLIKEELQ